MKCERCGRIARQKRIEKGTWVRFKICDMDGALVYELPMCAKCAAATIGWIYGRRTEETEEEGGAAREEAALTEN